MPQSAAERMAKSRARRRGELEPIKVCSVCGRSLKPSSVGQAYDEDLCFAHWALTEAGKEYLKGKRNERRNKAKPPSPFRYFGALPGEDAWPEGPFNRMRLAVSSTYAGKGQQRGTLFIVWTDDVVTAHHDVRQSDVGEVRREDGVMIDRSDLAQMARQTAALTERVRRYGHSDVYLV
jgi:hypothetical protein